MSETTFTKAEVTILAIALISLSFAVGVIGVITGMSIVGKNSPPPYIPFSISEVTTGADCSMEEIGLGGSIYDKVFLYTCGDSNWLAIVHENGTVTWSKAP